MHFPHSFTIQDVEIAICPLFPSKLRCYYWSRPIKTSARTLLGAMLVIMYDGETFKELRWSDSSATILPCLCLTGIMVNSH